MLTSFLKNPFLQVCLVAALSAAAASNPGNATAASIDPNCIFKADIIDVTEKTTTLRLFESGDMPDALRVSHKGSNPKGSILENKFLTTYSKRGLRDVISMPGGGLLLVKTLVRLGMIKPEAEDPFYSEMVLVSKNEAVDLRVEYPDKPVNEFLKAKRYLKKAQLQGVPPVLPKTSAKKRADFLYWETLKALNKIPDEADRSLDAVNAAFTEISRINEITGGRATADYKAQVTGNILAHLKASDVTVPAEWHFSEPVQAAVTEVPPSGLISIVGFKLANKLFQNNRMAKTKVGDPGEAPSRRNKISKFLMGTDLREEIPRTYTVGFTLRDPFELQPKARSFLEKYVGTDAPALMSTQFADEMEAAYPELATIRNKPGVDDNAVGSKGGYIEQGPFGPATFEGYKVMNRAALTLALVRGDAEAFPNISKAEFDSLRADFLNDMKLARGEKIDVKRLDEFFVFLLVDTLGRGRSEFLDTLDREHGFKRQSGTDYERRSIMILDHYSLASHSFARLDDEAQDAITECFKYIYEYNTGQVLQLEGGRWSFAHLVDSAADKPREQREAEIISLFYRSLLSFSALPLNWRQETTVHNGPAMMTTPVLRKWLAFRGALVNLLHGKIDPGTVYDQYLEWTAREYGLPLRPDNAEEVAVVRLSAESRSIDAKQAQEVAKQFQLLAPEEKAILVKAQSEYPILQYGAADFINQFVVNRERLPEAYKDKPYYAAMKALAHVYSKLSSNGEFQLALQNHPHDQIKVNIRFLVKYAMLNGPANLMGTNAIKILVHKLNDGTFEIYVDGVH